nr:retrovirus-related Pol polyprotein from transposon TNT 1-94 [Tanacetum cinerariifolium]
YDLLVLVGRVNPVEDNIGLLETTFDEDDVLIGLFPDEVTGSVNLTFLKLKERIKSLSRNIKEEKIKQELEEIETIDIELDHKVLNYARENAHLKATYKDLFDSIYELRVQTETKIASLQNELQCNIYKNAKLRTQLYKKVSDQKDNTQDTSKNTKFAKKPIAEILPKIGTTDALSKPVISNSVSTTQESKGVNNDKVIAPGMFRISPDKIVKDRGSRILKVSQSGYVQKILNNYRVDYGKSVSVLLGAHFKISAMGFEQSSSKHGLQGMTSGQISSRLDLTYAPSTITTQQPTEGELNLLFKDMYDDYIGGQPSATPRTALTTQAHPNVKEAMTDPAWIESMQEELLQFKRLDVWVLVPALDYITPLTLKWLFKKKHDEENTVIQNKTERVEKGTIELYFIKTGYQLADLFTKALSVDRFNYLVRRLAIAISCNPVQHSRTKHIAVRYHFIKEHVEKGTIELYFVKTDYQPADIFTKELPADRFNYLVRRLGMRSLSPQELERLAKSQKIHTLAGNHVKEILFKLNLPDHRTLKDGGDGTCFQLSQRFIAACSYPTNESSKLFEVMNREVKRLKQRRILIVKVRWNSRRGPEFTWEREDQMQKNKSTHFLPMREDDILEKLTRQYLKEEVSRHGMPVSIIFDHDGKFTPHFWKSLHKAL